MDVLFIAVVEDGKGSELKTKMVTVGKDHLELKVQLFFNEINIENLQNQKKVVSVTGIVIPSQE